LGYVSVTHYPGMSTRKAHQKIAANTLGRVESIVACTLGASLNSTFIASQLPVLDSNANPAHEGTPIRIVNADSFTAARAIARSIKEDCKGKIAVLNLASDELPGGGWKYSLSRTQVRPNSWLIISGHDTIYRKKPFATRRLCSQPSRNRTIRGRTLDQAPLQASTLRASSFSRTTLIINALIYLKLNGLLLES
jgi:hypothetical protein